MLSSKDLMVCQLSRAAAATCVCTCRFDVAHVATCRSSISAPSESVDDSHDRHRLCEGPSVALIVSVSSRRALLNSTPRQPDLVAAAPPETCPALKSVRCGSRIPPIPAIWALNAAYSHNMHIFSLNLLLIWILFVYMSSGAKASRPDDSLGDPIDAEAGHAASGAGVNLYRSTYNTVQIDSRVQTEAVRF